MAVLLRIIGGLAVLAGLWGLTFGLIVMNLRSCVGGVLCVLCGCLIVSTT